MGNYVKLTSVVHSSLTNLRCPGSSGGCGLGEVGRLIYYGSPLTHSPSISSRWVLSIVATAGVGLVTACVIILALTSPRSSYGMDETESPPWYLTIGPAESVLDIRYCVVVAPHSLSGMLQK